jgi:hypothetical protein
MIEQLQALAACGRPWAESRAQIALEITGQHQAGGISDEEYAELMMDIIRSDQLDAEADDLDTKSALVTSCMVLARVI